MIYILCVSPMHVFTALALKETFFKNKKMHMLMLDYSVGSESIVNKLIKQNIFNGITYIKTKDVWTRYSEKENKLFRVFFLLNGIKFLRKNGIEIEHVNHLIFPYRDPFTTLIAKEIFKRQPRCYFSYYDDGCAPYVNPDNVGLELTYPPRLELLFKVPLRYYIPHSAYMFSPNLFRYKDNYRINKIEIPCNREFKQFINNFFGYIDYQEREFIFFDQCGNDQSTVRGITADKKIIKLLNDIFPRRNIYIKKHPKRLGNLYEENGLDIYPIGQQVPFEVALYNMEKADDVVLVSVYSAACYSPKLLFGYEPTIIFLYKIVKDVFDENIIDSAVDQLRAAYSKPEKIHIPQNAEELQLIVNRINKVIM